MWHIAYFASQIALIFTDRMTSTRKAIRLRPIVGFYLTKYPPLGDVSYICSESVEYN